MDLAELTADTPLKDAMMYWHERALAAESQLSDVAAVLRIEQALALDQHPFRCTEIECHLFNKPVRAGDCNCHTEHARKHRDEVRAILAKVPA